MAHVNQVSHSISDHPDVLPTGGISHTSINCRASTHFEQISRPILQR